jgi:adenine/guanine phosphoribosyltransferase-like PRPP-binding protein
MSDVGRIGSRSNAYVKYRSIDQKIFMTLREAEVLSHDLAAEIMAVERPDLLVGIANGALLPTKIVADDIGVPFQIVHMRRRGSRYKKRAFDALNALRIPTSIFRSQLLSYLARRSLERYDDLEQAEDAFELSIKGKHIVVVDDAIYTGKSARHVQDQLTKNGAAKVSIAVLCWYKGNGDSGEWAPDIYLHRKDQYYPWSYSSPYLNDYSAWLSAHDLVASA